MNLSKKLARFSLNFIENGWILLSKLVFKMREIFHSIFGILLSTFH